MISIIHYISSIRRLEEANKTIHMLGGETEAPPMIRAQRDMITHEVDYYRDKVINLVIIGIILAVSAILCYTAYVKFKSL
jgi:hypothetical protein